jgi:acylglycerol lipase
MIEYYIKSKKGFINIIEGKIIENPKAILLHIHGLGSHFQFIYESLDDFKCRDNFFNKFNIKSFAMEFYSHGKSEGDKCIIYNFDDFLYDIKNTVEHIKKIYPTKKIIILAESMGGAVTLKYLNEINKVDSAILLSPMCGIDEKYKPNPIIIFLIILLSYIFPKLKFNTDRTSNKEFSLDCSKNNDFINAKKKCEYSYNGPYCLSTLREIYKASIDVSNNINKINVPILFIHGNNDKVTVPKLTEMIYNNINKNQNNKINNELILLDDCEHNLLVPNTNNDLTPTYVYAKILNWIEKLC